MIAAGERAPDFELPDQDGRLVSLAGMRGRSVLLVFYPSDFSPVCTDQLSVYEEALPQLGDLQVVGISVDGAFCHKAFREQLGVTIPLLADFHPKGAVARAYGVWSEEYGVAARALVVVDPDGTVAWSHLSPPLEVPAVELVLDALGQRARC